MAANYGKHFSTKKTPQTEAIPGKAMVPNSAGGFAFAVDDWARLDRFLILGSEGGSYYATEKKLTVKNAQCVLRCLDADVLKAINRIVEISESGRAPKNDHAIFALAMAFGHLKGKHYHLSEYLSRVCRTGTHLFQFVQAVKEFRSFGRSLRSAVSEWYTNKEPKDLVYQITKYQQRDGWSHRDILRLAHPQAPDGIHNTIFGRIVGKKKAEELMGTEELDLIVVMEKAKSETSPKEIARMIRDHHLVREHIPTQFLTDPDVWDALLEKMPMTALIRNLATMTRVGLVAPLSKGVGKVLAHLTNVEKIAKSRIHPVQILMALKTYAAGKGDKSKHTWTPVPQVIDALDGAFYHAFAAIEPTGKRFLFGIDVSHSMSAACGGTPMTCCEGATAMALTVAHTEKNYAICAFNEGMQPLPITAKSRLDDALKHTRAINGGGTNCAMPMTYALQNRLEVDTFVVLTDSETYAGRIHPSQALQEYRNKMGIPAKLAVVGMVSNGFTIADPSDFGMLDLVGWDSHVPSLISDFARN